MAEHHEDSALIDLANLIGGCRPQAARINRHTANLLIQQLQDDVALLSDVVIGATDQRLIMDIAGGGLETVQQRGIVPTAGLRNYQGEDILSAPQLRLSVVLDEGSLSLHSTYQSLLLERAHCLANSHPGNPE